MSNQSFRRSETLFFFPFSVAVVARYSLATLHATQTSVLAKKPSGGNNSFLFCAGGNPSIVDKGCTFWAKQF